MLILHFYIYQIIYDVLECCAHYFLIHRLAFHTKCVATANCGAIDRTCLNSILAWLPNSWDVPQSDCDILKLL